MGQIQIELFEYALLINHDEGLTVIFPEYDHVLMIQEDSGKMTPVARGANLEICGPGGAALEPAKPKTTNILDTTGPVETQTIPAGSELDSHILHADAQGANPPAVVTLSGSWTFDEPIVGISITDEGLTFGDSRFGLSTISYDTTSREVETRAQSPSNFDDVHVDPANPNRLIVTFKFQQGMDEIRVFTGALAAPGTLTGFKLNDLNANNQADAGEPKVPGWTIRAYVDANNNDSLDAGEIGSAVETQTNASGTYTLSLPPGEYLLCEVKQAGWQQSPPDNVPGVGGPTVCAAER